jgi:hypothetical protein
LPFFSVRRVAIANKEQGYNEWRKMVIIGEILGKKIPRTEVRGFWWRAEGYSPRLRFQRSSKMFLDGARLSEETRGFG